MTSAEPLRRRLVDAGVELLESGEELEPTLRAVARRAGVSHGAPRRYFPTHRALLAAIAADGLADLDGVLRPVLAAGDVPPGERLHRLALEYLAFARRRPRMFGLMFRHDLLAGAGGNLRAVTGPLVVASTDLVAAALEEVTAAKGTAPEGTAPEGTAPEGTVPGGPVPRTVMVALWTNVHGLAVLVVNRTLPFASDPLDLPGLVGHVVRTHLGAGPASPPG